jgi:hypothetical protein
MPDATFEAARKLVEHTLRGVGLDPEKVRAKSDATQVSWSLKRGSASVLVSVHGGGGSASGPAKSWLRVAASVMMAPAEGDKRTALFQKLLELNAQDLANAAFALVSDRVIVVSERPTAGLDAIEVDQMIKHLSAVADTYDDRLVAEFGGKRAADA